MRSDIRAGLGCAATIGLILAAGWGALWLLGRASGLGESTIAETSRYPNALGDAAVVIREKGGGGAAGWTVTSYALETSGQTHDLGGRTGWGHERPVWTTDRMVLLCDDRLDKPRQTVMAANRTFVIAARCQSAERLGEPGAANIGETP